MGTGMVRLAQSSHLRMWTSVPQRFHLARVDLLRQSHMGVIREGLRESQRAPVQALVQLAQLPGAAFHADVDYVRDIEFLNLAQFDIEGRETGHDSADLLDGGFRRHW